MQYKDYRDNIKLSRLGMGVMRLPVKDGNDALIDYERAKHLIDLCMEQGIKFSDVEIPFKAVCMGFSTDSAELL